MGFHPVFTKLAAMKAIEMPFFQTTAWVARDIKLSHSVFAMPFALLATFLAAGFAGRFPDWVIIGLIIVCMFLARTVAMTVNRWADSDIDAVNPRTSSRSIPAGRVSSAFMAATSLVCSAAFVLATTGFWALRDNPWPLILSPVALALVAGYSFTKRFTWLCHVVLGFALAASPVAAVVAVEPAYLGKLDAWLLAIMVLGWVAGFDIVYALQDVECDRRDGIFSMPSRLGVTQSLWIARLLHLASVISLVALTLISTQLGLFFGIGVAAVAGLLMLEHVIIYRSATQHINLVFFTLNGVISIVLGMLGIIDVLLSI